MYYVPQIWTPLQKPFQNSKYARMRSQTLLNILDLPRDSRMFSKFSFLVPLKECQITNLRGISFFPFVQGHFWIHRIFPSYFTAIKPYYIYRQQCFFLFYLLCLRYSFVHKHTHKRVKVFVICWQQNSVSNFRSDNLQYNTLGRWVDRLINQASDGPSIILID